MATVLIGMLGAEKDAPRARERKWRPSVGLCQQPGLPICRFELLYEIKTRDWAQQVAADVTAVSPETRVNLHELKYPDPWDFESVYAELYDFAREYPFAPEREEYLIHANNGTHVVRTCLFLLTESRHLPGKLIQSVPPARSAGLPVGSHRIIDLELTRFDLIASRFQREKMDAVSYLKSGIKTRNAAFNRLIGQIERVAIASKAPILLTGPTGTGKSLLARRIYELRKVRHLVTGGFVEINSATLRGDSAMSTLFGHVKGAFTGAVQARSGLLREAHDGILFLDEIGELGMEEQTMMLRAVEDKVFWPVGADQPLRSDFQLIAGTNRDLLADARDGRFREDLLARINVWNFRLPGLRERLEDIEPNLDFEIERYAGEFGSRVSFSREARARFLAFAVSSEAAWRGNFRDLISATTRMATLSKGGRISREVVDEELERLRALWRPSQDETLHSLVEQVLGSNPAAKLDLFERTQLEKVLEVCSQSRSLSEAGRILFAVSREKKRTSNDAHRLRTYLARYGIDWRVVLQDRKP